MRGLACVFAFDRYTRQAQTRAAATLRQHPSLVPVPPYIKYTFGHFPAHLHIEYTHAPVRISTRSRSSPCRFEEWKKTHNAGRRPRRLDAIYIYVLLYGGLRVWRMCVFFVPTLALAPRQLEGRFLLFRIARPRQKRARICSHFTAPSQHSSRAAPTFLINI